MGDFTISTGIDDTLLAEAGIDNTLLAQAGIDNTLPAQAGIDNTLDTDICLPRNGYEPKSGPCTGI